MNYDNLTNKQKKVFDAAFFRINSKRWFRGICLDNFPSDESIDEDFNGSVNSVIYETEMWDNPNFHIPGFK